MWIFMTRSGCFILFFEFIFVLIVYLQAMVTCSLSHNVERNLVLFFVTSVANHIGTI